MILHPFVPALLAVDLAAVVLVLTAAPGAARVAAGWRPGDPGPDQLALERTAEGVSLRMRWAAALVLLGGLGLATAISGVLPPLVPGAMCGTGVVQATGGAAGRALGLRLLALLILAGWRAVDRLDRTGPTAPLTPTAVRLALLATPVVVLAALGTGDALLRLDVQTPVDCCAAVFDAVRSGAPDRGVDVSDGVLLAAAGVLGGLTLLSAVTTLRRPRRRIATILPGLAIPAVPLAAWALVRVLAAYHYGVLNHHCPWCLFLVNHRAVGYPLFASLLLTALEAVALTTAVAVLRQQPRLSAAATAAVRRSAVLILASTAVFWLLAAGPALAWRLRYGVWM